LTITEEMLAAARRGAGCLGSDRTRQVREFYRGLRTPGGGFAGRGGAADLYYTVFGLLATRVLDDEIPLPATRSYLESFGLGERLDMVHVSCLARCWAILADLPAGLGAELLSRLEACRSADGGYAQQPGSAAGSAYGSFLALGASQDLAAPLPDPAGVARCLASLAVGDGSYANDAAMPIGSVPATAAAAMVLAHLGTPTDPDWLLAQHDPAGGFRVVPMAPEPDLLSSAVALQALARLGADISPIRPACLAYVESLYRLGGFASCPADAAPDAEYTFYGLLALGCLAE